MSLETETLATAVDNGPVWIALHTMIHFNYYRLSLVLRIHGDEGNSVASSQDTQYFLSLGTLEISELRNYLVRNVTCYHRELF